MSPHSMAPNVKSNRPTLTSCNSCTMTELHFYNGVETMSLARHKAEIEKLCGIRPGPDRR